MNSQAFSCSISTGINFEKLKNFKVVVRGNAPPKNIATIANSGLNDVILRNIDSAGYKTLTPIQNHAVPIILAKRDLVVVAQTGSGKTAAFLLPILHQISLDAPSLVKTEDLSPSLDGTQGHASSSDGTQEHAPSLDGSQEHAPSSDGKQEHAPSSDGKQEHAPSSTQYPRCLILTHTQKLALQIHAEANRFSTGLNLKCCVAYGDQNIEEQHSDLSGGCDILIVTPDRLLDFIKSNAVSLQLVQYAVLDEADKLLHTGFLPDVKEILEHAAMPRVGSKQVVMFSATFPGPIKQLASTFLDDYLFVSIHVDGSACADIEQTFYCFADEMFKFNKIVEILRADESVKTMIFLREKARVRRLYSKLSKAGFKCNSIHKDRSQMAREAALLEFRTGVISVLISTDVVSRGLDIPDVGHVINYDLPTNIEEYIHRIGHTDRVGNIGKATSFYIRNANVEIAKDLVEVLRKSNQEVPGWLMDEAKLLVSQQDIKQMKEYYRMENQKPTQLRAQNGTVIDGKGEVVTYEPMPPHQPEIIPKPEPPPPQPTAAALRAAAVAASTGLPLWDSKQSKRFIHEIATKAKMEYSFTQEKLRGGKVSCHATLGEYSATVTGGCPKDATRKAGNQLMNMLPQSLTNLLPKKSMNKGLNKKCKVQPPEET